MEYFAFIPTFQGHKEWLTEVNVLVVVEHPNLVKLVGYCAADDERGLQRLILYEYMPNRSVDDHLSSRLDVALSWDMRLRIDLDVVGAGFGGKEGECYLEIDRD